MINERKRLGKYISDADSLEVFKSSLLKFIWSSCNSFFKIINPVGIQLLRHIRVGLVLFTLGNINLVLTFKIYFTCYVLRLEVITSLVKWNPWMKPKIELIVIINLISLQVKNSSLTFLEHFTLKLNKVVFQSWKRMSNSFRFNSFMTGVVIV